MRKDFGLSEYSFHCDVKDIQKHFKDNINSFTAQKIATTLWKAYDKLFYGNGKHIYYKKYGTLNSLEGKSSKSGIRFKHYHLEWVKDTQFNHIEQNYEKKLSQRWNDFNGIKIQRDLYSAFLIMNINKDLKSFDINKCNERFETFLKLHNFRS